MEPAIEPQSPAVYVRGNSDDETLNKLCKLEEDTLMNQSFQKRKFSAPSPLCSVCNACMNVTFVHRLRELCVKLMFLHPVDYGRKAEELLWRKVYYEVIQVIKTNKKVRVQAALGGNSVHSDFFF